MDIINEADLACYPMEMCEVLRDYGVSGANNNAGIAQWRQLVLDIVTKCEIRDVEWLPLSVRAFLVTLLASYANTVDTRLFKKLVKLGLNIEFGSPGSCPNCNGTGQIAHATGHYKCWKCKGAGTYSTWGVVV